MYKSVIFDLDGTLLDTLTDLSRSVNYALGTFGLPTRSETEIRSFLGNGIRFLMECAVGGKVTGRNFEPVFEAFRTHYVSHCLESTVPYDGIPQLLAGLQARGTGMAIVSNKIHAAVQELNERFFSRYISTAVGESETVRRKPNPDAVLQALEELGGNVNEAIYVGDSEVDLETAHRAGLPCILVTWGFRDLPFLQRLPGARLFATRPHDILDIIDKG